MKIRFIIYLLISFSLLMPVKVEGEQIRREDTFVTHTIKKQKKNYRRKLRKKKSSSKKNLDIGDVFYFLFQALGAILILGLIAGVIILSSLFGWAFWFAVLAIYAYLMVLLPGAFF